MTTRERINNMPIHEAEELCKLLCTFKCGELPCEDCALRTAEEDCISLLLCMRVDDGLC